ncbi:MAG TPA: GAF domain-containing protein [Ktedonobacterales bacterium]|nr:GAF domain-containing protein [Ktedonobacterales bacterium]
MTEDVSAVLQRRRDDLRERLQVWADLSTEPEEGSDAALLLDALCSERPEDYWPRFALSAHSLAGQGGRLEARLRGVQRWCEGLGVAIDDLLGGTPTLAAAAHAKLTALQAEVAVALAQEFQRVKEQQAAEETERARRGLTRLQALQRVNSAANSTLDLDLLLETTAAAVADEMGADLCTLFLFDTVSRELELRATNGPLPASGRHFTLALRQGYTGVVAREGRPLLVADALADPRFEEEARAYSEPYRGLLSVPIIIFTDEHDKLVGVISVQTREAHTFSEEEVDFLEIIAGQLAMSIENGRLYKETDEELRRKVNELSSLHRVSALVASTLVFDNVLRMIVAQAVQISNADRSVLFELDPTTNRLTAVASQGFEGTKVGEATLQVGACCAGRVVQSGEHLCRIDCMRYDESCFLHSLQDAVGDQHSVLCVPLSTRQGPLGALCIYSSQRHEFNEHQVQLVKTFANVAAIAMENARLFEQTREGLRTKEVLLREMHHRVKNNLQQVASILNMQRRRTRSPEVGQILIESVDRIQGIAATHDLLSNAQLGVAHVDEIARKIVGIVRSNLVPPQMNIRFRIASAPFNIASDQATTLAIVLNELIANAIEHGFEGRERGEIRISGARINEHLVVRVADDGTGLPSGFSIQTSDGLGLQLVTGLAKSDLRGTFTIFQAQGNPDVGDLEERISDPSLPSIAGVAGQGRNATPTDGAERTWTIAQITFPDMAPPEPVMIEAPQAAEHVG